MKQKLSKPLDSKNYCDVFATVERGSIWSSDHYIYFIKDSKNDHINNFKSSSAKTGPINLINEWTWNILFAKVFLISNFFSNSKFKGLRVFRLKSYFQFC